MDGSPHDHVDGKFTPKSFGNNYGGSSDDQRKRSPLVSTAKATASSTNTSLESSTSSSSGRSNVPNFHYLTQGRHTVPDRVRSGENLDVAGAPQGKPVVPNQPHAADTSTSGSSSSVYPNSDSGDGTAHTEVSGEEGSPTPTNALEGSVATLGQIDADGDLESALGYSEDEHRENRQICPRITVNTCTLMIPRREIFDGIWTQRWPIHSQIKMVLPVACQRQKDPSIHLKLIPCQNENSRHVNIEGELLILRDCSRYKWLVEYCRCSIVVTVSIINPADNTRICSVEEEYDIRHSELNIDHRTTIKLEEVLHHDWIIYNSNMIKFAFRVTVQLLEHEVVNHRDVPFECVDSEEFEDLSIVVPMPHL